MTDIANLFNPVGPDGEKRDPSWDGFSLAPEVIEPTEEAALEYGTGFGCDLREITQEHIDALLRGKVIAIDNGEYSTFLMMKKKR